MENNGSKVLDLTDFIGKGRSINLSNFREVEQVRKNNLEKADKTDIEKGELGDALGYQFSSNNKFKKKGSEIVEKVKTLSAKVEVKKAQCLTDMNKIVEDLGFAPMQMLDKWDLGGMPEGSETMKKYSWEQCCFSAQGQTANCIVSDSEGKSDAEKVKCASSKEEADKCRLYNNIMWNYQECCRDLDKASVFIRNVDEKTSYQLTLDEMKSLGF